ncbi:MAG TPA: TolC family protein [Balneolales bacterium]|nr:TolC family protein [Balneolales bacterium]
MIKNVLLITVGLLLMAVPCTYGQSATPDSLTLQEAIHNVLENQPGLNEIQDQVKAAQARVRQAHVNNYPKAAANVDYSHINPVPSVSFANGGSFTIAPYNNYNFNVAVNQTLYDFGRTNADIALAKSQVLTAKDQANVVKWTLSYYTVQVFYGILFLHHGIKVENEQISTLQQDLELVKKRQESGAATNYDLLTTKVQIATEKNRKVDLENTQEKQLITLRKLMGWDQSRPVTVKGSLAADTTNGIWETSNLDMNMRPDYQILKDKENIYKKQYDLARTVELPSLNAEGMAGFKDGYPSDLNKLFGNILLGVNLRVPIFSGYISRYKQQEAKAQIQLVKDKKQKLARNVKSEVAQAQSDFEAARKKLKTANLQIEQANEQIKLARIRYENGVITNQDLLDSETKLAQARLQRLNYIYQMKLSRYNLQKALGEKIWK